MRSYDMTRTQNNPIFEKALASGGGNVMQKQNPFSLFLAGSLALALISCAPPKKITRTEELPPPQEDLTDTSELDISDKEFSKIPELQPIYFEFNRDELTPEARETLKSNTDYLSANSDLDILVEGHCDERGTTEYNLALGQRRAANVRRYYTSLGVRGKRLGTISYGEEKPADPGHDETAWSKNRRAETKVRRSQQAMQTNP